MSLAAALAFPGGAATAGEFAVGLTAGALGQGGQGTLNGGASGGVVLEFHTSERTQFGLGYTYGRDPGGGENQNPRATVYVVDARARRIFGTGRLRPYLDLGLGWYHLHQEYPSSPVPEVTTDAAGAPIGAGAAITLSGRTQLRVGVEYHMIALDPDLAIGGGSGGDLGDFFWIGVAYTYRLTQ